MGPRSTIAAAVMLGLAAAAAWFEYGQYSSLMRRTASADVAQLCLALEDTSACPDTLSFPTRPAEDPWSHPYHCRAVAQGLIIYTLGADDSVGGSRRDADIACATFEASPIMEADGTCFCGVEDSASALLR